jgi:hypothetical protein
MDTVMQSLRGHSSEERERLRQEHTRLQQLQTAVIAEGESLRADVAADRRRLAERWTAFEDAQKAARSEVRVCKFIVTLCAVLVVVLSAAHAGMLYHPCSGN